MSLSLLDYGRPHPFGETFGKTRNLAWPVHAYRVTLPKAGAEGDELNPFERVILKLLRACGALDAQTLAAETCIPLDLVKGMLLRLQDKDLIDKYGRAKETVRDPGKEEAAPVFVTALLFRELATGKILPYLHLLGGATPLRKKEGDGTAFGLIDANDAHRNKQPEPRDVIRALLAVQKRSAAFGVDGPGLSPGQITLALSPESYFLDCPIAIQKYDGDTEKCDGAVRIADPFGNGFSLLLESTFEQLLGQGGKLAKWLGDWQAALRNPHPAQAGASVQRARAPFETEVNWQRYPKLVANLRPARNAQFRTLAKLHACVEWALFYACCQRPFAQVQARLEFTALQEHPTLLGQAAATIGLVLPKFGFKAVPLGKLLDFQKQKAELGTVLAIALLQAETDGGHPLRRLASLHPDLASRLLTLKKARDQEGHGHAEGEAGTVELADDAFMCEVVQAFLPEVHCAGAGKARPDLDARADAFLDARANLQGEFGFKAFHAFGANLQERLLCAERFWLSCRDGDDALVFAWDLYAALQVQFRQKLSGQLPPAILDAELLPTAQRKGLEQGLGALPECLRCVPPLKVRQALQGNDPTLNACVVAWVLNTDAETLQALAGFQPSFLEDVATVINCRGHGNEPRPLPKADLKKLRRASYNIIKTLSEV